MWWAYILSCCICSIVGYWSCRLRPRKVDGAIEVDEKDTSLIFQLNLEILPEDLAMREKIILKVVKTTK